jgi:hypothetical protein
MSFRIIFGCETGFHGERNSPDGSTAIDDRALMSGFDVPGKKVVQRLLAQLQKYSAAPPAIGIDLAKYRHKQRFGIALMNF